MWRSTSLGPGGSEEVIKGKVRKQTRESGPEWDGVNVAWTGTRRHC